MGGLGGFGAAFDGLLGSDLTFTAAGPVIRTQANEDLTLLPNGTGITIIGDAGATNHALAANDDLFVAGKLEVDGPAHFDAHVEFWLTVTHRNTVETRNDVRFLIGAGGGTVYYNTSQTPNTLFLGVGPASNHMLIAEIGDRLTDFGQSARTDPTFIFQSADATAPEENGEISWDRLRLGGGAGSRLGIQKITEEVTIAVGQGAAGVVTAANLAPANALILSAVFYITQAPGGGALLLDMGRTGAGNLDELIDGASCDVLGEKGNTIADRAADTTQLPIMNAAADTLTLTTDANVTGTDMKVRVVVFYIDLTEPTS